MYRCQWKKASPTTSQLIKGVVNLSYQYIKDEGCSLPRLSVTAATLQWCTLRRLGVGKNTTLAPVAEVHGKGMISVNPEFCIFPCSKESVCNTGNPSLIPGSGRSPGEGNGNSPLQYSYPESSMDRGAWVAYSPRGLKELDVTEWLTLSLSYIAKR